jgi:hypothetical protein
MSRRRVEFARKSLIVAPVNEIPIDVDPTVKRAIISDEEDGSFVVEYDNTIGTKTMRLEAMDYEEAVAEIKSFLNITDNRDEDGNLWEID